MSQDSTYSIIERDHDGEAVNAITGLHEDNAKLLASWLRSGTAYTGDRPWTVDITRELTIPVKPTAAQVWRILEPIISNESAPVCVRLNRDDIGVKIEVRHNDRRAVDEAITYLGLPPGYLHLDHTWREGETGEFRMYGHYYESPGSPLLPGWGVQAYCHIYTQADASVHWDGLLLPDRAPVVHRGDSFWKGDEPGSCGASCVCGTTFDGFDSLGEASDLVDRHIEVENAKAAGSAAPQPIPAERVAEILAELNRLTKDPDVNGREPDWWDWIADTVPEFDAEATANSTHTGELHLTDGTVLRWSTDTSWTRQAVA